jgi:4-amino-4-deoxy-L-arabinose transferase-like glycosyltransferase
VGSLPHGLRRLFSRIDPGYLVLLVVCIMSLSIRLWLLDKRWINPDEGPHLMDAVLVLDGKIPQVDFASRELIYVYSIAGFLKLFGTSYVSGRLLPMTCSLLVGIVAFLLATELFDRKVGLLSSVTYWMLPLEVTQSVLVKTEPLVSLLTCLAFYGVARFSRHGQGSWLIVGGMFSALGFYARPSALIIPVAVSAFIVLFHRRRVREVAERLGLFLAGYVAVVLCVLGYYSRFVSPRELGGFSPVGWAVGRVVSAFGRSSESIDPFSAQASAVSWGLVYWGYLHQAFYFNCFLILGLGFSILECGYSLLAQDAPKRRASIVSESLLYLWLFFLFSAYAFYFYSRGFFIDYSREFLPPLVIVLSAWVMKSIPSLGRDRVLEWFIAGGVCLSGGLFLIHGYYPESFGIGHHASLAIALITLFTFAGGFRSSTRRIAFVSILSGIAAFIVISREVPWKGYLSGAGPSLVMVGLIYGLTWTLLGEKVGEKARPSLREYGRFVCLSTVLAAFVVSVSFSATLLGLTYDSIWSPQSVEKIASDLKAQTGGADEVMSGGVIWELQASRRPFKMISHPLVFEYGITEEQRAMIEGAMVARPPKAIILDGYTEKTYMRVPRLAEFVNARYQFESAAGPAVFPVRLYRLKEGSVASESGPRP